MDSYKVLYVQRLFRSYLHRFVRLSREQAHYQQLRALIIVRRLSKHREVAGAHNQYTLAFGRAQIEGL